MIGEFVTDGRHIADPIDPQGERSVYIYPGETESEAYRILTFRDFPSSCPADCRLLASNGFYYTGFEDRVKCFSCGQVIDMWSESDDPTSPSWHRSECEFVGGTERRNVPLHTRAKDTKRRTVSPKLPSTTKPVKTSQTKRAPAGLVLMFGLDSGSQPSTYQTARCATSTSLPRSAAALSHQNSVKYHTSSRSKTQNKLTPEVLNGNEMLFPCNYPVNPRMRNIEDRLRTFMDGSSHWPAHRIRASPKQLAEAGLYYLGEKDRVKCWYCNGGLYNWEPNDQPWSEHAKCFPTCEFLLRKKGRKFVEKFGRSQQIDVTSHLPPSALAPNYDIPPPVRAIGLLPYCIDQQEEHSKRSIKVDDLMSSDLIQNAKEMGFEDSKIRRAVTMKLNKDGSAFGSFEELVDFILSHPEKEDSSAENDKQDELLRETSSSSSSPLSCQEIDRIKQLRSCKNCRKTEANVVLLPCGHLACCRRCSPTMKTCPICKVKVSEIVKSYIT